MDFLHSFAKENKCEFHKRVCKNKGFCNVVVIFPEDSNILEFNQYWKSAKVPFIIFADLESLKEKTDGCKNNPEKSFPTKWSEHVS